MKCRFGGHSLSFYSVAQHSYLVSKNVPPEDALWGLFHDAAEAYLPDLLKPIKGSFSVFVQNWGLVDFGRLEFKVLQIIAERFNLSFSDVETLPESVKKADLILLATEKRDLMGPSPEDWRVWVDGITPMPDKIIPFGPKQSESLFLHRFKELTA